jgi:colanic acid biosynthesis glycosyl transferase WcaI
MNILLLNQFFAPPAIATGELLADVARRLAAEGHRVKVVCARGNYAGPAGDGLGTPPGVTVVRTPALPFSHGAAARLLSYASFAAGALREAFRSRDVDLVLSLTTPPLLPVFGSLMRKFGSCRHFIWEMDLFPDAGIAAGLFGERSAAARVAGVLARWSRRNADGIIALGPCMAARLESQGVPPAKIRIAENWTDGSRIHPVEQPDAAPFHLLYSGNLGMAHDLDTILTAMQQLDAGGRHRFTFAGGGPRRAELERRSKLAGIRNAAFLPYQPAGRLSEHLGGCHAGLVTQKRAALGCLVPSKFYMYLAAARPVLFVGPPASTIGIDIERYGCGWQVEPGDGRGLASLLALLASRPDLARDAGRRARRAFLDHYDLAEGTARIAGAVNGLRSCTHSCS